MAVSLPFEIQNDSVLYAKNEELKGIRAELISLNSKIESGTFSGKSLIENIYTRLNDTIDYILKQIEIIIIPQGQRTNFSNGLVSLDEYGSFDIIKYYNELYRLKWVYYTLKVAIMQMNTTNTVSNNPAQTISSGVLNQLNDNEFLVQGSTNPVYDQEVTYKYYTIISGDTLPDISKKMYNGDPMKWPLISSANNLYDSDLLDNNLAGRVIKIPIISQSNNKTINDNIVYELSFSGTSQKSIEQFLYGQDIYLNNKKMEVSNTNDIRRVKGMQCVVQNIQSRFYNTKGSLNPLNVSWGVQSLDKDSNIPPVISLDRLLTDMESQAMADPRVVYASILRNKLRLNGDAIVVEMEIQLIGNEDLLPISIEVPQ